MSGIVKLCLALVLSMEIGSTVANACICSRFENNAAGIAAKNAMTAALASDAVIIRGVVVEQIDHSRRVGELIRVEETLVGDHRDVIRIWRPFTAESMRRSSCEIYPSVSIEPTLLILFPVNEDEVLAWYAESGITDENLIANAPSEEFFLLLGYCETMGADIEGIVETARALDRVP